MGRLACEQEAGDCRALGEVGQSGGVRDEVPDIARICRDNTYHSKNAVLTPATCQIRNGEARQRVV